MTADFILLGVCLFLSSFFSSAETALFSISRVKALYIAKNGSRADRLILEMKKDSHTLLTTVLIGNNLVNICASAIATSVAIGFFHSNGVGIAIGIMTFLILVFGEIFPKSIATHNNIFVARLVIFPLYWLSKIFFPLIVLLNFIPKILGKFEKSQGMTEDELITMVEVVEKVGEIKEEEKEYITNIFEFDDTRCSEIMTPRADMFVYDVSDELDIEAILKTGFSRIPVIEDSIDNIIGILHVKDLFDEFHHRCLNNVTGPLDIRQIMKKPFFIPESKKLDSLLHEFKKIKNHIGIVVDEHGGVSGLVTLEDVVEEIIGDISDETDQSSPDIVNLKGNKWLVNGKTDIYTFNKEIPLMIPESESYDTFSGYILEKIGRIPKVGETIGIDSYQATVKEKDGNRIKTFVVEKIPEPNEKNLTTI